MDDFNSSLNFVIVLPDYNLISIPFIIKKTESVIFKRKKF